MTPSNDNFVFAKTITGANGQDYSNNIDATTEIGEPASAGKTIWWKWVATATDYFTFSTDGFIAAGWTQFESVLQIFTGSTIGALTEVSYSEDQSKGIGYLNGASVTINAVSGTTYRLRISTRDGSTGFAILRWAQVKGLVFLGDCGSCDNNLGSSGCTHVEWALSGIYLQPVSFGSFPRMPGVFKVSYCGGFHARVGMGGENFAYTGVKQFNCTQVGGTDPTKLPGYPFLPSSSGIGCYDISALPEINAQGFVLGFLAGVSGTVAQFAVETATGFHGSATSIDVSALGFAQNTAPISDGGTVITSLSLTSAGYCNGTGFFQNKGGVIALAFSGNNFDGSRGGFPPLDLGPAKPTVDSSIGKDYITPDMVKGEYQPVITGVQYGGKLIVSWHDCGEIAAIGPEPENLPFPGDYPTGIFWLGFDRQFYYQTYNYPNFISTKRNPKFSLIYSALMDSLIQGPVSISATGSSYSASFSIINSSAIEWDNVTFTLSGPGIGSPSAAQTVNILASSTKVITFTFTGAQPITANLQITFNGVLASNYIWSLAPLLAVVSIATTSSPSCNETNFLFKVKNNGNGPSTGVVANIAQLLPTNQALSMTNSVCGALTFGNTTITIGTIAQGATTSNQLFGVKNLTGTVPVRFQITLQDSGQTYPPFFIDSIL